MNLLLDQKYLCELPFTEPLPNIYGMYVHPAKFNIFNFILLSY